MDARTHRLLHAPIGPTLLRLAVPNVVVMLVQALVGLIETAFDELAKRFEEHY